MNQRMMFLIVMAAAIFSATPLSAADDAIVKDLKATLALHGKTCDEVTNVKRNGDSDYLAACKDGNRYRVFVDAQGRVVVQKQ